MLEFLRFTGLFPSLLKLLTTHFPQLCIVNEWLEDNTSLSRDVLRVSKARKYQDVDIPKNSFENGIYYSFIQLQPKKKISTRSYPQC